MGDPDFCEIWFTKAIWIGVSWEKYNGKLSVNILIPFLTVSFLI